MGKELMENMYKNLEVKKQIKVAGIIVNVPVKYKTQVVMGLFPISTKKAISFIDNKRLKPAQVSWGKSLLGITIFNHIECPVGPYKEIALSIPIFRDATVTIPFFSLLLNNVLKNFGFFSFLLTGSTDIGREHAEKIWGYPFYNKNIDVCFEERGSMFYVMAVEKEKQKKLFSLTVMKAKNEKIIKKDYQTYFLKDNKLINVTLNTIGINGSSMKRDSGKLELGDHEISDILKGLSINIKPQTTIYSRETIKIANIPQEI